MSSHQRLLEILTQSGLIDRDLEAERIRAQRDVARTSAASALLGNLVPQVVGAASSAYGAASKAQQDKAGDFVASQAGKLGALDDMPGGETDPARSKYDAPSYLKAPGAQAAEDIASNKDLAPIPKTGNILLDTIYGLPNMVREGAASKATAARTQQITADRAAARAQQMAQLKAEQDAAHQAESEKLARDSLSQGDRHFVEGQRFTREQTTGGQAFTQGQTAAQQTFTASENEKNRRAADRRQSAALAATKAKADATAADKAKGKIVPAKIAVDHGAIQATIHLVDSIGLRKPGIDTGPLASAQNWIAQKMGISDPEVTRFKADVGEQLAEYIKSISGATVSNTERAALQDNVPRPEDNDDAFVAKLDGLRERLQTLQDDKLSSLDAAGYDVGKFGGGHGATTSAAAPEPTPAELDAFGGL